MKTSKFYLMFILLTIIVNLNFLDARSAWDHHGDWDPDHKYPINIGDFEEKWAD